MADTADRVTRFAADLVDSAAAETMFSHPSKLELVDNAHAAGYSVIGGIL